MHRYICHFYLPTRIGNRAFSEIFIDHFLKNLTRYAFGITLTEGGTFVAALTDHRVDGEVIRSSLAAQFTMNLREFADLTELTEFAAQQGYKNIFLTDPHGGESCFECQKLFDRSVVVIGSEAHGIAPDVAGNRVTIPMPGNFESLNAAQAATIVLFEHVRRITGKG